MKAEIQSPSYGRQDVFLETTLGDVEYEISFDCKSSPDAAQQFADVITQQAAAGHTLEIKKKLGHEHLLKKRASVRYAETVAMKKIQDQPEGPVTTSEIISSVPIPIAQL
mmetsp:Transcript_8361/g.12084  ORF Transcript_8361/g.12084 Transcript_8361/m.12084 type:complete len:110 (-) Transcript_8361:150-479(-)